MMQAGEEVNQVVIPIQTISFYNSYKKDLKSSTKVVIPIQTISFYNSPVYRTLKKSFGYRMTFL